jgi:hypothetical protein
MVEGFAARVIERVGWSGGFEVAGVRIHRVWFLVYRSR